MSATVTSGETAVAPPLIASRDRADGLAAVSDRTVVSVLLFVFTAIVAVTWRKWGMPEGDAGAELTTADLIRHGAVAYQDVRYFYGPLGLYSLALAFKLFGTSLTVAYAFGIAQAAGILGVFYVLARQWLTPLVSGLSTAVLLAIGFSGTSFNFVLPHTNSATFGLLTLLLMLLALRKQRHIAAGVALGLVALTRPEFFAVAVGSGAAYVVAAWRSEGRQPALDALWRLALPAGIIAVATFGWFAARAGLSNLLWQNLWPKQFISAGVRTEQDWMPLTISSLFGLLARGAVYCGLLGALVVTAEKVSGARGSRRLLAVWPLLALAAVLALADGVLRGGAVFTTQRAAIEGELRHLVLGMSWLPALGIGVFVWTAIRLARRREAPLSGSWPADFALIVAAVGLGLRAYNAFTAEGSYAPYYAAPLVLLLGILHARVAARRPGARVAVLGALGLVGVGLGAYALVAWYRHLDTPVHTPRGTFVTFSDAAPALQRAVHTIDAETAPGQRIFVAPLDAGLYFFSDRQPASYALTLLPGLLATRGQQAGAIARIQHDRAQLAVIGARDLSVWQTGSFGTGYDRLVGDYLRAASASTTTIGSLTSPAVGTFPSHGFTILRLRNG
jgi:4-amino-4-deoxy-L-arabinose transferase-like glycosyltransferase